MAVPPPANVSPNGSDVLVWHCKESIKTISPGSLAAQYVAMDKAFIYYFFQFGCFIFPNSGAK